MRRDVKQTPLRPNLALTIERQRRQSLVIGTRGPDEQTQVHVPPATLA